MNYYNIAVYSSIRKRTGPVSIEFENISIARFTFVPLLSSHPPMRITNSSLKWKDLTVTRKLNLIIKVAFQVTSMLLTDVGDQMYLWQVWDIGDRFRMKKITNITKKVANIMFLAPKSEICHQLTIVNDLSKSALKFQTIWILDHFSLDISSISQNDFTLFRQILKLKKKHRHFRRVSTTRKNHWSQVQF